MYGLSSGCAFVTYKRLENAKKAMEALNGHVFKGRPITVDWGVDKKAYEELKEGLIDLPKPDFNRLGFSVSKSTLSGCPSVHTS